MTIRTLCGDMNDLAGDRYTGQVNLFTSGSQVISGSGNSLLPVLTPSH